MVPHPRKLLISVTAAALIAVGGAAYALQSSYYTIVAGPVTGDNDTGINGSFQVQAVGADKGIASDRIGGACILFRAEDLGFDKMAKKNCKKDPDCGTPGENDTGYCDLPTGQCWAKPVLPTPDEADAAVCVRSIEFTPPKHWDAGVDNMISAQPIPLVSLGVRHNAKARVVACLNGSGGLGCGGAPTPFIADWGKPKQLH